MIAFKHKLSRVTFYVLLAYSVGVYGIMAYAFKHPDWWFPHRFHTPMVLYILAIAIFAVRLAMLLGVERKSMRQKDSAAEQRVLSAAFVIAVAAMSLLHGMNLMAQDKYLEKQGIKTLGLVTEVNGGTIHYTFNAIGEKRDKIAGSSSVDKKYLKDLQPGSRVMVEYPINEPSVSRFVPQGYAQFTRGQKWRFNLGMFHLVCSGLFVVFTVLGLGIIGRNCCCGECKTDEKPERKPTKRGR
jgi:hypothetical protein